MEPWKKHSSATGGYFQCNRYEVSNKVIQSEKNTIDEAESTYKKITELNRFVHYYSRFKNHEHSYKVSFKLIDLSFNSLLLFNIFLKLEEPLLSGAKHKYELLTAQLNKLNENSIKSSNSISSNENNTPENELKSPSTSVFAITSKRTVSDINLNNAEITASTHSDGSSTTKLNEITNDRFIEDAIRELLRSRRILRCSYVYGYYLDSNITHKKFIFELIQTEFEECCENLSQIIARPYLKTPKNKIIKTTKLLKRKRIEFLETIAKNLELPDTPPSLKKHNKKRWRYLLKDNIEDDDELKKCIALSLKDLNPKNPWIVDKKGRHTNLIALLDDSPDLENELESLFVSSKNKGICNRWNCDNAKAINTLSGALFNYCSIKCMKSDREVIRSKLSHQQSLESAGATSNTSNQDLPRVLFDDKAFNADLQRAIEMSRLEHLNQLKREAQKQQKERQMREQVSSDEDFNERLKDLNNQLVNTSGDLINDDLQLAIELSLQTYNDSNISDDNTMQVKKINDKKKDKLYKLMPYDTLYMANENDLGTLFRNMNDIIYENDDQQKYGETKSAINVISNDINGELASLNNAVSSTSSSISSTSAKSSINTNKKLHNFEVKSKKLKIAKTKPSNESLNKLNDNTMRLMLISESNENKNEANVCCPGESNNDVVKETSTADKSLEDTIRV